MSETYLFMSQPRPVETRRRYRPKAEMEEELGLTANIMFDARVQRGTTVGRPFRVLSGGSTAQIRDDAEVNRKPKSHLVRTGKIRPTQKTVAEIHDNIRVVKKRVEVPLHLYLIEQDAPLQSNTIESQTDQFLEEPQASAYIPRKTGIDTGTQVEFSDDIFDFDSDVQTILDVVISKTMEQGVMEVRQEERLKQISETQAYIAEKFRILMREAEKREEAERGLLREKELMLEEKRARASKEEVVQRKLASNVFSKQYLAGLQEQVFEELRAQNFFVDSTNKNAEAFLPHLTSVVMLDVKATESQQKMLDELLGRAIDVITKDQVTAWEARRVRKQQQEDASAKARVEELDLRRRRARIQLYIHSDVVGDTPIGPINVTGEATIKELERKAIAWITTNSEAEAPNPSTISWLWNGSIVPKSAVLYNLGVSTLATLEMMIEVPESAPDLDADQDVDV